MSTGTGEKRKKAKILRWRGVLGDRSRMLRWMVAIVLAVAGTALTFTQLGFVDLELPDGTVGYVVALLQVVALGALLLGTLAGTALGLVTGGVLLLHAQFLPLDHYEFSFVTPLTSIVMFGVCGAMLGILFAFVLRKDPSQVKRIIYISIVCLVVSLLYSIGFAFNVFVSLIVDLVEKAGADVPDAYLQQVAASRTIQLGDMGLQAWSTALVMAVLCSIGDYVARRAREREGALGLRSVFGVWLAVVVALAFMSMSAVSFAVVSGDQLRDAQESMQGEVEYLGDQIRVSDERVKLLQKVTQQGELDYDKVDEKLLADLSDLMEDKSLVEGYSTRDDGVIIMALGDMIYASDDERIRGFASLDDVFDVETLEAIERSKETGEMQRFVFDDVAVATAVDGDEAKMDSMTAPSMSLAYLYAKDASNTILDKDGKEMMIDQSIIMIRTSAQVFATRASLMEWTTLLSLVLLVVVYLIVFQLLNRVVAQRIDQTNGALARVTAGDLDARVEVSDPKEFESLSKGINATVDTLKGWIAEAEARMDAELATAKAIQEAALPRVFPPFPDILKFDVYASMNAARQVGGDFYDFFLVGDSWTAEEGKLGFVVADVSGKGVPAALFMMRAKALLRDYVGSEMELGEAVEEVNRQLVEGNDEGMFVTAWVGVLDYGTGHVDYVNAGHNPPLLWQRESGWRWMREKSGPVLGLFEMPYRARSVECRAGDTFLLYTDGVTEAFDVDEKLYGEERLLAVAEKGYRLHPRELLESVRDDVALHAQGAEQSDDITILTLEVGVPPEITSSLEVPAEVGQLYRVNDFLHAELDRRLCPHRVQGQLDIAVEELFVNVCHYAYPDATPEHPGSVRVQRTYSSDPPSIVVDIIDEGIPYNPLAKPDAVTPSNIEDVPIGGLGILMAKRCTDEMRYERVNDSNVVTIVKKW